MFGSDKGLCHTTCVFMPKESAHCPFMGRVDYTNNFFFLSKNYCWLNVLSNYNTVILEAAKSGKRIATTEHYDTGCGINLRANSTGLCSSTQAVAVYSTCGAGGTGSSLLINRKGDPIASWSVVTNVEPVIGIGRPKNLNKPTKHISKVIQKGQFQSNFLRP